MIYYQQTRTSRNFVNKSNHTKRSFLQAVRLPILVSATLIIAALCFALFSWHQESQQYHSNQFSKEYNQGMANLSAAYLGHLIEDENTDAIESIGQDLANNKSIQKLTIYRRNGELIYSQENDSQTSSSTPVIANISYEGNYNGYLVIYFAPIAALASTQQPFWVQPYMVWIIGVTLWFCIFLLLTVKRRKKKPSNNSTTSKSSNDGLDTAKPNGTVLKELIKRNRKNIDSKTIKYSLVINADWSKLDDRANALLLRILSRWMPQNGLFATQFSHGLLVLGLDEEKAPIKRNPLYALERCLLQLQLQPKILLHHLDFDRDIYQMFFEIIEPGIWYEKTLKDKELNYDWPTKKVLDIELETHEVVELCRLEEPDAEQRGAIERQVRYLSEE